LFRNPAHRRFTTAQGGAKLAPTKERYMADTRNGGGKTNGNGRKNQNRNRVMAAAGAGAAIGIGSAALVAALLYANKPKDETSETRPDPRFEPRES
jgi:hypothetical protein